MNRFSLQQPHIQFRKNVPIDIFVMEGLNAPNLLYFEECLYMTVDWFVQTGYSVSR